MGIWEEFERGQPLWSGCQCFEGIWHQPAEFPWIMHAGRHSMTHWLTLSSGAPRCSSDALTDRKFNVCMRSLVYLEAVGRRAHVCYLWVHLYLPHKQGAGSMSSVSWFTCTCIHSGEEGHV